MGGTYFFLFFGNVICAVICARWALELGYSQLRQMLILGAGLLLGPLALVHMYILLVIEAKKRDQRGADWV